MPVRARLTARAADELDEAVRWIAIDSPRAARGLRDAVVAAATLIAEHPFVGAVRPELAPDPFRFISARGYPHLIVYDPTTRPPTIMRIVHGARDLPEVLGDL